jgi:N6-adenosine-specific RNA methylase IME4
MAVEDIAAIDVRSFYSKLANLFLWVPARHLDWGNDVAKAWGFVPLAVLNCIVADSQAKRAGSLPDNVMICRSEASAEYSLAEIGKTRYHWEKGDLNSRPEEFYELVMSKSAGPYLELFPRSSRKGWDYCGRRPTEAKERVVIDVTDAKAEQSGSIL